MSDASTWQESNARQLGAALGQLRHQMERFAEQSASPAAASPAEAMPTTAAESAETTAEPPSALDRLCERLGLSPFERNLLLLCAAMELDTRIPALCARAQDDPHKNFPTFALALTLFEDPSWDVLSPERPLRFWRLIEIVQSGTQPLTASALRADERIVHFLKGLNYLDERLLTFLMPLEVEAGPGALAPSQRELVELILHRWQQPMDDGRLPVAELIGADTVSKQCVAAATAARLNRRLHRLPVELLPANPAEVDTLARLWQRECRLLPLALYLDAEELSSAASGTTASLNRFLARSDGVFFLGVREVWLRPGRSHFALDIAKPGATEQQVEWAEALGARADGCPAQLAGQFNLNLVDIQKLARVALADAHEAPEALPEKIWAVCCASERPRLDLLAQRLEPKVTWEDLVLPDAEMKQLQQIAAQVAQRNTVYGDWGFARKMNRGFSISVLFAGDSGTGKTMAAEVIAHELRLNLYRIDLSQVVNKYIGETEKNLRRLFDAAEDGGAILFFDEADALFGKRSEVKDSHDRYANIEINYLLQRLEAYRGLAILATNMKSALDPAFLRRLRFIVNFPFPGTAERRRLWAKVFLQPDAREHLPAPPLGKLDYDRLARLNLSPGCIHNAALNACFLAAHAATAVTMPMVLEAARGECAKLGRPVNESDFHWAEPGPAKPRPAARAGEPVSV